MDKTHIKHAICFIQDKELNIFQIYETLLAQIKQTSWCGGQYIHSSFQAFYLTVLIHTPIDDGESDVCIFTILMYIFIDLSIQFPCSAEDQCLNIPRTRVLSF